MSAKSKLDVDRSRERLGRLGLAYAAEALTTAIQDGHRHKAHIFYIRGSSYRLRDL